MSTPATTTAAMSTPIAWVIALTTVIAPGFLVANAGLIGAALLVGIPTGVYGLYKVGTGSYQEFKAKLGGLFSTIGTAFGVVKAQLSGRAKQIDAKLSEAPAAIAQGAAAVASAASKASFNDTTPKAAAATPAPGTGWIHV